MIRILLLATLLALQTASPCLAQQPCTFTTNGSAAAHGLNIKFSVPCKWETEDTKGKVLKEYEYEDGGTNIGALFIIDNATKTVTPGQVDELITAGYYEKRGNKDGTFLWGNKLNIDGQDFAEVALKMKKKVVFLTAYVYMMRYVCYYKNKIVMVTYMVTAQTDEEAKRYFNTYKTSFRNLATATDFLD